MPRKLLLISVGPFWIELVLCLVSIDQSDEINEWIRQQSGSELEVGNTQAGKYDASFELVY